MPAFDDYAALLAAVRPDVVCIATRQTLHAEQLERAVATGVRGILCDKPLATSLGEVDRIVAACDRPTPRQLREARVPRDRVLVAVDAAVGGMGPVPKDEAHATDSGAGRRGVDEARAGAQRRDVDGGGRPGGVEVDVAHVDVGHAGPGSAVLRGRLVEDGQVRSPLPAPARELDEASLAGTRSNDRDSSRPAGGRIGRTDGRLRQERLP